MTAERSNSPADHTAAHASARFWQDRPVLVTGGTGLVGSWLVRRLREAGADVVCLVRDWVPQSELVRARLIEGVRVVRGDVRDQALLERALGEYEVDTVFHLAAQTIVGIANRNPISTFETNIQRHLGPAGGLPPQSRRQADRGRLLRQGLWRPANIAYTTRRPRCRGSIPTTSASRART